MKSRPFFNCIVLPALFGSLANPAWTNPVDPEVISGSVEFSEEFTDLLEISQHSDKAIIHWEGFSISSGEVTKFLQPGADSAVLNRVVSGDTSSIEGALEANGNVLLINPNGILFGAGARVDTNGFIASTLDVPDVEFLAGGDMRFSGSSQARVVNLGEITAKNGDVFLVGATVTNTGNISASNGTVGLAAGQQVLITKQGDERVFVEVGSNGSVDHDGAIRAAQVELKAAGGNPKALAVNVAGRVEATGVQRVGGRVYLSGGSGKTRIANRVKAAAPVRIESAEVEIAPEASIEGTEVAVNAAALAQIDGRIQARDEIGNGGPISINAPEISIGAAGDLSASGSAAAGSVQVVGDVSVTSEGQIRARSETDAGGIVTINAPNIAINTPGRIDASGTDGGFISVGSIGDIHVGGQLKARGLVGNGGLVMVSGDGDVDVSPTASLDASGEFDGGQVFVEASDATTSSGTIKARGRTGSGGFIFISGDEVAVNASGLLDVSGGVDGGFIHVQGASSATIDGELRARGEGEKGGMIRVDGDEVSVGATGVLFLFSRSSGFAPRYPWDKSLLAFNEPCG
ncbi:MAG: filamentous hemagglutinin N-terminal domain-containing protein [Verrucomicrobiota bacterium]